MTIYLLFSKSGQWERMFRSKFNPLMFFSPPLRWPLSSLHPAVHVVSSLHHSAQQRSSQTNKSQSSATNQVSVWHVLCVAHKQRSTRSSEYCTPTQRQDGYCTTKHREREKQTEKRYSLPFQFIFGTVQNILYVSTLIIFYILLLLCSMKLMHAVLYFNWAPWHLVVNLLLYDFITVTESDWVLLLYATVLTGVVVETFPFVWTPPVSSRCHFAFHPHPLVRISAALLWVSVGEYCSLWVLPCRLCLQ